MSADEKVNFNGPPSENHNDRLLDNFAKVEPRAEMAASALDRLYARIEALEARNRELEALLQRRI